ncbi:MAG: M6 family metalloprotease domain-containing protein, partial [Bacteroidales bacterium]
MKLINTFLRVFFLITLFHFGLFAAPANKTQTHTKTQPNGKTISYISNGDEFMSWLSSIDGYTMFENAKGEIVYATKDENAKLVKSNILASDPQQRSADEILFLSSIEKGIFYNTSQLDVFNKLREERYANTQENYIPTIGTPNFLVILVNFTDVTFNTANATKMSNQIKQTNYTTDGATGSVKDYFYDNSMGTLNANFTVVGPYTLSHNQAYYGAQDSYDNDVRPREMVAEACLLANPHINYANFDNDGDGYVDMIHIVYAGRGEHNGGGADAIWPHSWGLSYPRPNYDGVTLRSYSCSNELRTDTEIDGIGTICHEMGHVLGLPDFYDTDYEGTGGQSIVLGSWDLMSSGNYNNESRTPPYLSALERNMLGWLTPIILTNNNTPCTLPAISDSNKAYKVNLTSNEFFIFEHRNKKKWDAYTPAKGMLVFHGDNTLINQWINSGTNEINVDPLNRGFFILPAYGDSTNNTSTSTTFPGSQNVTSFIGSTLKSFTPTGKALTEISYGQDSVLNFTYFNIIPNYNLTILPPTNITTTSATLNGTVIGSAITSMGFQYRKLGTSNFTQQTVSTNPLQLTISNLTQNTIYEYRLFIISSIGTTYSNIETFFTDCGITLNPPFSEGFESTLTCWNNISSSTDNIDVVQNGGSPSCTPHGGTRMLKYNSYNIYANEWAGLITPKITFPHSSYEVSLWIYRYNGTYSQPDEGVEIYINSSISLTGATQIGFISNNISEVPVVSSNGWYKYSCNVGSAAVGEKYIILKVVSNYGYNTYIDDLSVTSTSQTLPPTVITSAATTILQNTATLNGAVVAGSEVLISQGFEWKQSGATNWTTSIAALTSNSITNNLIGLIANTTYQFRAYATTATGTTYGSVHSFTTLTSTVTPPTVITSAATTISQNTATLNGAIVTGSEVLISQGFEWKQSGATNWTTTIAAITGNSITHNLIGLNANTTYQFRAYATTATGTTYGSVQSFTTLIIVTPPTVITSAATTISQNTATLNGAIVTGSEVLISQGFEW